MEPSTYHEADYDHLRSADNPRISSTYSPLGTPSSAIKNETLQALYVQNKAELTRHVSAAAGAEQRSRVGSGWHVTWYEVPFSTSRGSVDTADRARQVHNLVEHQQLRYPHLQHAANTVFERFEARRQGFSWVLGPREQPELEAHLRRKNMWCEDEGAVLAAPLGPIPYPANMPCEPVSDLAEDVAMLHLRSGSNRGLYKQPRSLEMKPKDILTTTSNDTLALSPKRDTLDGNNAHPSVLIQKALQDRKEFLRDRERAAKLKAAMARTRTLSRQMPAAPPGSESDLHAQLAVPGHPPIPDRPHHSRQAPARENLAATEVPWHKVAQFLNTTPEKGKPEVLMDGITTISMISNSDDVQAWVRSWAYNAPEGSDDVEHWTRMYTTLVKTLPMSQFAMFVATVPLSHTAANDPLVKAPESGEVDDDTVAVSLTSSVHSVNSLDDTEEEPQKPKCVLSDGRVVVGTGFLHMAHCVASLHSIVVRPEYQRRGIGKSLVRYGMRVAAGEGYGVCVTTRTGSALSTVPLFHSAEAGFRQIGRVKMLTWRPIRSPAETERDRKVYEAQERAKQEQKDRKTLETDGWDWVDEGEEP